MVNGYGRKQLIPIHTEDSIFNFYLNKEVKSTETKIVNNSQYGMVWYGMVWYGLIECAVHVHRQVVTSRQLVPPAM